MKKIVTIVTLQFLSSEVNRTTEQCYWIVITINYKQTC